ncbi:MAG TPA: PA14 domain-containing protein [Chryseosolibacter sp.]
MRIIVTFLFIFTLIASRAQVDTALIYNPSAPFGPLDLRISKSAEQHYYLREGETFSFREVNGVRTNTFLDMTAWDSSPYKEGSLRQVQGQEDSFVMNYRLLVPQGYDESFAKGYPLVIVLHGLLERGNCAEGKCYHATRSYSPNENIPRASAATDNELLNNDYNLIHAGSNYLDAHTVNGKHLPDDPALPPRGFPGFVVFPQNLNGWDDGAVEDAIRIVRLLQRQYNIDDDRIYINGISHGGHGAYKAMMRAPWLFAAGVLFSAADDANATTPNYVNRLARIPLWLFQGGQDLRPTQPQTERYVRQLKIAGASVRYTLYPELGHGTWNKAMMEPDFFSWMLRHKRNNIHVYADNPVICPTSAEGTRLMLPEGFAAYEWQLNGVTIGAAPELVALQTGVYRARFLQRYPDGSERWNEWSEEIEVVTKEPGIAEVNLTGTRFLPDPNGSDTVTLVSSNPHDIYRWYKNNNTRLRFDDSVSAAVLTSVFGDGKYFLKGYSFDECATAPSIPLQIYFDDRAPFSVTAPSGLEAISKSPVEIMVTWVDNSDNESGFEVWRRKRVEGGRWTLSAVTSPDAESFTDASLDPSSEYEYQIRAITELGRSPYFPSDSDPVVWASTLTDTQPPASPTIIDAQQIGVETIVVHWHPAVDNSTVSNYILLVSDDTIRTEGTDTSFVLNEVNVNTHYSFRAIAVDAGGNRSAPSNEVTIYTAVNGLYYQHTTGAWETLADIDWTVAEFKGKVTHLTLAPKTQDDFFNFRFDGYLQIQQQGIYQFRISSDDGSSLSLGDSLFVSNDGIHTMTTTTSPIQLLASGPHRFRVDFFDYDRSDSLVVEYKGPDTENQWVSIPAEAFRSDVVTSTIPEIAYERLPSVYPNPTTSDNINVSIPGKSSVATVSLHTAAGQLIIEEKIRPDAANPGFRLRPQASLAPGLYLIKIKQDGVYKSIRMIIK